MAKYPQGVSGFIPQYQPYQVDFNYVNNVLATKQDQYDKNWKAINKVYGQLYYADLTHPDSIQKKEQLEKQIDFNLKRVAGLDLSLSQNATQALQIFKPFYEDNKLMYDMAFTKNAKMQKLTGESYSTATDEKLREQAWSEGIKAIDYKIDEFRNSPYDQIFSVASPKFVPYQNVSKKAMAYAKEMGIKVKDFTFTKDGRYIIEQQNGQPLVGPLYKMFMSTFGNDESIMDVYKTQAYVNRKDYMYANKDRLGSLEAAEAEYLNTRLTKYKGITEDRLKLYKNQDATYTKNIQNLESQIAAGNKDPRVAQQLQNIREAQQQNATMLTKYQKSIEVLDDGISRTANTKGGVTSNNLNDLRYKVDFLDPNYMLEQDLQAAAESYATTTSERTIKTNQFKLQEERAGQARSLAEYKDKLETNRLILKAKLDSGQYELVQQNGQEYLKPKKELNEVEPIKTQENRTKSESQQTAEAKQEQIEKSRNDQTVKSMFNLILKAHENGDMSDEEFFSITNDIGMSERYIRQHPTTYTKFGFPSEEDTPSERRRKIANFNSLSVNEMSPMSISEITAGFKNWVVKKNKLSGYENDGDFQIVSSNFNNLEDIGEGLYTKRELKVKRAEETARLLDKESGTKMGKYLFDSDGNMRDELTMIQMMVNDKIIRDDYGNVVQPGKYEKSKDDYFEYTPAGFTAATLSGAALGAPAGGIGAIPGAALGAAGYIILNPLAGLFNNILTGSGAGDVTYVDGETDQFGNIKTTRETLDDLQRYALDLQERNLIKTPLYGYNGAGAGKFTMNSSRIKVMPGAFNTDNYIRYSQLNNTLKNLSFTKDNARASVTGSTANDWNNATDEKLNMVAQNIIADVYEYSKNKKNKDGTFNLDFHPVANDALDYAGVTIKVPEKVAEKYKMKNEGKANESGYLSAEVYDKLIANGLTVMTKSSEFVGTDLYNNAFIDPVESRVRAQYAIDKSPVTYTNPYYDGYSISFGMTEGGKIMAKQIIPTWDPNINDYVDIPVSKLLSGQGLQLQQARNNFWSQVASMNEQNNR
jgi:hypothetical protein